MKLAEEPVKAIDGATFAPKALRSFTTCSVLMKHLTLALLLGLPFFACAQETCPEARLLQWVLEANPDQDADRAMAVGDYRFLAVYGFTIEFPGLSQDKWKGIMDAKNFRPIEGTSDAYCSKQHASLGRGHGNMQRDTTQGLGVRYRMLHNIRLKLA